jgi:ATP-binding cassette subfamily B protein
VRLLLGFGILNVINTVFALTSALSVMIGISGKLTAAALASAPLLMAVTRWFSKQMYTRNRANQEALGAMSERVQASLAGVRVVRSLSLEGVELRSFEKACREYLDKSLSLAKLRGFMGPILGSVGAIGVLTVFWYGGHLVLINEISRGQFISFWSALTRLIWPLLALGFVVSIVQRGRASYDRLRSIYEAVPDVLDGPLPAPDHIDGDLRVKGLSMSYGTRKVLDDVSFHVPAGSSLAIVGRTGSGKSTLAAMLPRLLPTPDGTVFLDDIDVCQLPRSAARRAIGYAQQDSFLFSTTIAQNIGFSLDEVDSDEAMNRVRAAAAEAQVLDEVNSLPGGFDTVVGERGIQLSGGQRQRVALARAFLWEPSVLVLDDPLSAVDARTEAKILDAISRQASRRTLLLITHRVAAAARCDQVIVLDQGKVVERGTHEELLAKKGIYAEFAEEQQREGEMDAA